MNNETERRFRSELRSFFGLIMLNLLTAAMAIGLGIALSVATLMERVQLGDVISPSLVLVPLGVAAAVCGVYWIIQTVDLMRGVKDIYRAYEALPKGEVGDVTLTSLMIKMIALYRANPPLIRKMKMLSKIGGAAIILLGAFQIANELWAISNLGFVIDNIDHLISGGVAIAVGVAGLLTAPLFFYLF